MKFKIGQEVLVKNSMFTDPKIAWIVELPTNDNLKYKVDFKNGFIGWFEEKLMDDTTTNSVSYKKGYNDAINDIINHIPKLRL